MTDVEILKKCRRIKRKRMYAKCMEWEILELKELTKKSREIISKIKNESQRAILTCYYIGGMSMTATAFKTYYSVDWAKHIKHDALVIVAKNQGRDE